MNSSYIIYLWQGQWLTVYGTILSASAEIDTQKRAYMKLNIVGRENKYQVIAARSFYVSNQSPDKEPWEEDKTPSTL